MLGAVEGALYPYVTSSFGQHGLLATINIAARVIGGVVPLSIGKIIDIRGRLEGFLGALLLITIGMIMKATCKNVETYAAAHGRSLCSRPGMMPCPQISDFVIYSVVLGR